MKDTITVIAEQVNAKELNFARFILAADEKNDALQISKNGKHLKIKLNMVSDTYTVTKYNRAAKVVGSFEGVYNDMLQDIISKYFNFEYVMEGLVNPAR